MDVDRSRARVQSQTLSPVGATRRVGDVTRHVGANVPVGYDHEDSAGINMYNEWVGGDRRRQAGIATGVTRSLKQPRAGLCIFGNWEAREDTGSGKLLNNHLSIYLFRLGYPRSLSSCTPHAPLHPQHHAKLTLMLCCLLHCTCGTTITASGKSPPPHLYITPCHGLLTPRPGPCRASTTVTSPPQHHKSTATHSKTNPHSP